MEDQTRPRGDDQDKDKLDREANKSRFKKPFGAWSDVLPDTEDDEDETTEEDRDARDSSKELRPKQRGAKSFSDAMKALFEKSERPQSKDIDSAAGMSIHLGEYLLSDYSGLRPELYTSSEDGADREDALNEDKSSTLETAANEPSESLELPPVVTEFEPASVEDDDSEPPIPTQPSHAIHGAVVPPAPPNNRNVPPTPGMGGGGGGMGGNVVMPPNIPNVQPNAPNVVEFHTHNERLRGAVAGLLMVDLVDYVSTRRREGKIKKKNEADHAKFGAEQAKQRQEHANLNQRTRSLEVQAAEQAARLRREAEQKRLNLMREQIGIRPATDTVKENPRIERVSIPKIEANHAVLETVNLHQQNNFENTTKELLSEVRVAPTEILQAVEKAAEQNVAIESLYERRHEALGAEDNAGWDKQAQTTRTGSTQTSFGAGNGYQQPTTSGSLPIVPLTHASKPEPYKQAVKSGFWMALVLILIFLLAVIVVR